MRVVREKREEVRSEKGGVKRVKKKRERIEKVQWGEGEKKEEGKGLEI